MKTFYNTIFILILFLYSCRAFGQDSWWINYGESLELHNGTEGLLRPQGLFPDSVPEATIHNAQIFMTAGTNNMRFHSIGQVLDITSDRFAESTGWDTVTFDKYSIDSIALGYLYFRNIPGDVPDTLVMHYFSNENFTGNLPVWSWPDHPAYGQDVDMRYINYNPMMNSPLASGKNIVKIPLGPNSVTSEEKLLRIPVPAQNLNNNSLFSVVFSFIPAYPYQEGDVLNTDKNYFCFTSLEENGNNTWPSYYSGDNNVSLIITYNELYQTAFSFNAFVPAYAWGAPAWEFEHHRIFYHVTPLTNTDVHEYLSTFPGLRISPNPANNLVRIRPDAGIHEPVELSLIDMYGRMILPVKYISGMWSEDMILDISNLLPGTYLLRAKFGNRMITDRLIIH